jgi:hypothetical protein
MGKHQPALLGGLFIGVLSLLPIIGAANLCCCLWVIVGGVLVTYLKQQGQPTPVETSDVAVSGLLAGVIGAVISSAGFMLMSGLTGPAIQDGVRQALEQSGDVPPQVRDMVERFTNPRTLGMLMFVVNIPLYAVFAMLGSLLGLAFFRKKTPPQAPPMQA